MKLCELSPIADFIGSEVTVEDAILSSATFHMWERLYGVTSASPTPDKMRLYILQRKECNGQQEETSMSPHKSGGVSTLLRPSSPPGDASSLGGQLSAAKQRVEGPNVLKHGAILATCGILPPSHKRTSESGSASVEWQECNMESVNRLVDVDVSSSTGTQQKKRGRSTQVFRDNRTAVPEASPSSSCATATVQAPLHLTSLYSPKVSPEGDAECVLLAPDPLYRPEVEDVFVQSCGGDTELEKPRKCVPPSNIFESLGDLRGSQRSKVLSLSDDEADECNDNIARGSVTSSLAGGDCPPQPQVSDFVALSDVLPSNQTREDVMSKGAFNSVEQGYGYEPEEATPSVRATKAYRDREDFCPNVETLPVLPSDHLECFLDEKGLRSGGGGELGNPSSSSYLPYFTEAEEVPAQKPEQKKIRRYRTPWFCGSRAAANAAVEEVAAVKEAVCGGDASVSVVIANNSCRKSLSSASSGHSIHSKMALKEMTPQSPPTTVVFPPQEGDELQSTMEEEHRVPSSSPSPLPEIPRCGRQPLPVARTAESGSAGRGNNNFLQDDITNVQLAASTCHVERETTGFSHSLDGRALPVKHGDDEVHSAPTALDYTDGEWITESCETLERQGMHRSDRALSSSWSPPPTQAGEFGLPKLPKSRTPARKYTYQEGDTSGVSMTSRSAGLVRRAQGRPDGGQVSADALPAGGVIGTPASGSFSSLQNKKAKLQEREARADTAATAKGTRKYVAVRTTSPQQFPLPREVTPTAKPKVNRKRDREKSE
ncbi:uncharacterized protein TEOVI_000206000 [Trypanosoma equiperdum]|uniref:Uncharacterized protein n=1 Tax=Trypanosoma equiperdum TaxID=5694 RepID=A0A1G4IE06_TRYEQ|nr:hypothetical protein, conserved [Trypanosoma equiperdum]